jgi:hypothetical protein
MTKFVNTKWNVLHNIKCIEKIEFFHKDNSAVIHTTDDRVISVAGGERLEKQLEDNSTVIPAQPGFMLLFYHSDSGDVDKLPVIAWAIDPTAEEWATVPITVDGVTNDSNADQCAVLQPDGIVIRRGLSTYQSYDDWYKEISRNRLKIAD